MDKKLKGKIQNLFANELIFSTDEKRLLNGQSLMVDYNAKTDSFNFLVNGKQLPADLFKQLSMILREKHVTDAQSFNCQIHFLWV